MTSALRTGLCTSRTALKATSASNRWAIYKQSAMELKLKNSKIRGTRRRNSKASPNPLDLTAFVPGLDPAPSKPGTRAQPASTPATMVICTYPCRFLLQYAKVVEDCTAALELDPHYVKALLRRAQANELLEHYDVALEGQYGVELRTGSVHFSPLGTLSTVPRISPELSW